MSSLGIFAAILLTMVFALTLGQHGTNAILDKTRFVEFYTKDWDKTFCQSNRTKGIYNPMDPGSVGGSVKCCKGKSLVGPFLILIDDNVKNFRSVQLPEFTNCDYNVTIENGNDDFGTLMWKSYVCKMKSILGKAEKDIDFKTYVEFRTINYTKDHNGVNLQNLIRDGMSKNGKGCQGAEKEPVFLKKVEKYFWCFQGIEQKICEAPTTTEAKIVLNRTLKWATLSNNMTNVTCPLVPAGTRRNDFCCHGASTPSSWLTRFYSTMSTEFPTALLPNGTAVPQKSYLDCIRTSENLTTTNNTDEMFFESCYNACELNPVTFSADGSTKPEVKLEFGPAIVDKYLSWFNTKARNTIRKLVPKIKAAHRISTNEKQSQKQNGIIFNDAGKAFKKLTNPREKAMLYCAYYREVDDIMTSRSIASAMCSA